MAWQNQKPVFILFEGGEGSGKTTQAQLLYGALKRAGRRVKYNDEPGSTKVGFKIRAALLDASDGDIDPFAEFLLFEADRALDFSINIIPLLSEGVDIVQDRNFPSTFAYQGYGRRLIPRYEKLMRAVDDAARHKRYPDLIFLLDGDPGKLMRRIRKGTSFEKEKISFHQAVRKGFLRQARGDRKRWVVLDALQPADVLRKKVWQRVAPLIG